MEYNQYEFTVKVRRIPEFGGWHYVHVPKDVSAEIKQVFGSTIKRGWGSIPITALVGQTTWQTSIFPTKEGEYFLALKSQVRQKENIGEDDIVNIKITIREN